MRAGRRWIGCSAPVAEPLATFLAVAGLFVATGCGGDAGSTVAGESRGAVQSGGLASGPTLPARTPTVTAVVRAAVSAPLTVPRPGDPTLTAPTRPSVGPGPVAAIDGPSVDDVEAAQRAIDEVHGRVGDAYRRLRSVGAVDGGSEALLTSVFTGEALESQLRSFEQAAGAVDVLANTPGDPVFRITAVRAVATDCFVVAGEVDDRPLYAFPDAVAVRPAVARLERAGGVWRVANVIDVGAEGAQDVVDAFRCVEPTETRPSPGE